MIAFFSDKGSACPISNYDLMKDQKSFIVVSYEIGTFLFEKYIKITFEINKTDHRVDKQNGEIAKTNERTSNHENFSTEHTEKLDVDNGML